MACFTRLCAAMAVMPLIALTAPASAAVPTVEYDALVEIYNSTNGAGWSNNTNWLSGDPCGPTPWAGVVCTGGPEVHRVTEIHLSGNNLTGPMPAITAFTELQRINLSDNALTGPMPSVSGLTALRGFWTTNNQFTGFLPDLSSASALEVFHANNNQLVGPIPNISGLTTLQDFRVSTNKLTGTPPAAPSGLLAGGSSLCPNYLHAPSPTDTEWSAATGEIDWSRWCTPGYLVTASAGAGGAISAPAAVAVLNGETASFTVAPDANYAIDTTGGTCGGALAGNTYTTDPVDEDCNVTATFRATAHVVTPSAGPGGSITPATPQTVPVGETFTFTIAPDPSYVVDTVVSTCGGSQSGTQFTTGPVDAACDVAVTFKAQAVQVNPVPTLHEWALFLTILLAAVLGAVQLRKRRAA